MLVYFNGLFYFVELNSKWKSMKVVSLQLMFLFKSTKDDIDSYDIVIFASFTVCINFLY